MPEKKKKTIQENVRDLAVAAGFIAATVAAGRFLPVEWMIFIKKILALISGWE